MVLGFVHHQVLNVVGDGRSQFLLLFVFEMSVFLHLGGGRTGLVGLLDGAFLLFKSLTHFIIIELII